jgi:hypothetical protein
MALSKSNSLTRRYAKLDKYHAEIMKPSKGKKNRQCVHSSVAFKKYVKTFRQICLVENADAKFMYSP